MNGKQWLPPTGPSQRCRACEEPAPPRHPRSGGGETWLLLVLSLVVFGLLLGALPIPEISSSRATRSLVSTLLYGLPTLGLDASPPDDFVSATVLIPVLGLACFACVFRWLPPSRRLVGEGMLRISVRSAPRERRRGGTASVSS